MKIDLKKKPQNVTIIGGFPGFGLVGTISSEYLIEHLGAEKIGSVWFSEMNPMIAIHESKIVEPFGVFYSKKHNIVILHAITNVAGVEWKIANVVSELSKTFKAKEVICVDGVGSPTGKTNKNYYYYTNKNAEKWKKTNGEELKEGVVVGPAASLILKVDNVPMSCVFAETASKLPDSRAAAQTIKALDEYLGLSVDYNPLLKKAEEFEVKLKKLIDGTKKAKISKDKKDITYMG